LLEDVDQPVIQRHEALLGHLDEQDLRTLVALLAKVRSGPAQT
jgi:hypothetical protein